MNQREIDIVYLRHAWQYAEKNSVDPSTQNGAIIVRKNRFIDLSSYNIMGYGTTTFPSDLIKATPERLTRPKKYDWVEHAERNAIFNVAREGKPTKGCIMYVPWFACADCGRAIINAEISEVVGSTWPEKWWGERDNGKGSRIDWAKSIETALEMFDEVGVKYRWVDGEIGGVQVLFDEKLRSP